MLSANQPQKESKRLSRKGRLIVAAFLAMTSIPFFFATTDREFIDLQPTEGVPNSIILHHNEVYEQKFAATRNNITQVSLFIRPAQRDIPTSTVTVQLVKDGTQLAQGTISTAFIDTEGASHAQFEKPIKLNRGEEVSIQISVPQELDGALRLQQRNSDETFDPTTVQFTIDGAEQQNPLAYQVYYQYRPPLALQLAGLLLLAAQQLLYPSVLIYCIGAATLFDLPETLLGHGSLLTIAYATYALIGTTILLRTQGLSTLTALAGAHIFAFTTWLPLHTLTGRNYMALAALIPYGVMFLQDKKSRNRRTIAAIALYAFGVVILSNGIQPTQTLFGVAHPRDIFVDPYQVPTSHKTFFYPSYGTYPEHEGTWDNYGSYIGIINIALASIGIVWKRAGSRAVALLGAGGILIALVPPITATLATILPFPPQYAIIAVTFAAACYAGRGLQALQAYLGNDRTALVITTSITIIALLDLWQVAATTLETSLLT